MEGLEVEWRRTDSETLVHLYQDGESRPESQQQDYHDRAHFFTDQIQHGNFSLCLDNLRAEDEGRYTCKVYSQQHSGETVVQIRNVVRLIVSGSSRSISASVGEDVTLNCSVDSHITPEHIEEVSWKKTDEDEDILVLIYLNNGTLPDSAHERYRDRVEFFTAEIPKGNFSLRLKSVRIEDKGVYMCQVFAGGLSANATVKLERLGFSVSHIMVLILCISASGSVLLLCCLIYCRSPNKGFIVTHSHYLSIPFGSSVVLPCYIDRRLLNDSLEVEWRRTDSETLVHLYQDGESRPEKQEQDYRDRAHFFTDEIEHGNFSLRLDNLRAEDVGIYTCTVYSQQKSVFSNKIYWGPGFFMRGSSGHLVAPLGSSVVLPCYVDELFLMGDLTVEWRRTDSKTLVHLYQDGESLPEAQQQDYHDRANFFTESIKHGNFSLLLDNLKAEDVGEYRCTVYSNQNFVFETKTNLELILLESFLRHHLFLVICPNVIMFFAFVSWGVSEGSLFETVSCCALYFLRPLLLLWAAPYVNDFTGNIKTWILKYSYVAEYAVFSTVVYSALFTSALEKILNYAEFERGVVIMLFSIVFLSCLCKIIYFLVAEVGKKSGQIIEIFDIVADMSFEILPTLQFILLFYTFGSAKGGFMIVVVLPLLLMLTNDTWIFRCEMRLKYSPSVMRTLWLIFILVTNAVMIGLYIMTLENKTHAIGWGCVMVFLQTLWSVMKFTGYYGFIAQDFRRFVPVYVFGSVGAVLLNSVTLMTELILKTVNGNGAVGDLRITVFSSEFLFIFSVLILPVLTSWIKCLQSEQIGGGNASISRIDGHDGHLHGSLRDSYRERYNNSHCGSLRGSYRERDNYSYYGCHQDSYHDNYNGIYQDSHHGSYHDSDHDSFHGSYQGTHRDSYHDSDHGSYDKVPDETPATGSHQNQHSQNGAAPDETQPIRSHQSQTQKTAESLEMKPLMKTQD